MDQKARQRGVTSIEYALLAALIAVAIVVGLTATGLSNGRIWSMWTEQLIQAVSAALGG